MNDFRRFVFLLRVSLYAFLALLVLYIALLPLKARAVEPPVAAYQWRGVLIAASEEQWGADAPVATFGAQVETESNWNPTARSSVGASGLAQFMGPTARWLAGFSPALGGVDTLDPLWSLRALVAYDRYLWQRQPLAATTCDRAAFMQSAYNGGEAALAREQDACIAAGCDPDRWWDNVEHMKSRGEAAWRENHAYPARVRAREPKYRAWGRALCQ
jgi:membrane-bound lytic murein transglycosylase MltF